MKARSIILCAVIVILVFTGSALAKVDVTVQKTLKLKKSPIDVAVSADGLWTYVLTEGGKIQVFSTQGKLTDTIDVDRTIDGIEVSQKGDNLILLSSKNKTVQIVSIDMVRQISIEGSPFRGDPKGSVVVAVFSDFQ